MKRDMDLVRQILLKIEEHEDVHTPPPLTVDRFTAQQIEYHIDLMRQANLLTLEPNDTLDQPMPIKMTWAGHDFLDAAREPSLWDKAKQKLGAGITSVSFEVLKELLGALAKSQLGIAS